MAAPKADSRSQADKFRYLARELGADEDPVYFEETLEKIAKKTPETGTKKPGE